MILNKIIIIIAIINIIINKKNIIINYILGYPPFKTLCNIDEKETLPVLLFHGANDNCYGLRNLTQSLYENTNSEIICVVIGEKKDSVFRTLEYLIDAACDFTKSIATKLKNGYHVLGHSTGGLIARGIIEKCETGDKVITYFGVGVPQMGVSKMPMSEEGIINKFFSKVVDTFIYLYFCKNYLSAVSFYKNMYDLKTYYSEKTFYIKDINNEVHINEQFRNRIKGLKYLLSIGFEEESYLIPKESVNFEFFDDNKYIYKHNKYCKIRRFKMV